MNQPQGSGWGDTCTFVVLIMTAGFPSTKSSGDLEEHDLLLTGPGGYTVTEKILRRGGKNTQKNCTKKIFTTQIIMMV